MTTFHTLTVIATAWVALVALGWTLLATGSANGRHHLKVVREQLVSPASPFLDEETERRFRALGRNKNHRSGVPVWTLLSKTQTA